MPKRGKAAKKVVEEEEEEEEAELDQSPQQTPAKGKPIHKAKKGKASKIT